LLLIFGVCPVHYAFSFRLRCTTSLTVARLDNQHFFDDEDSQAFLDTLAEAHRLWQIEIFAYCLMRNHYHLCLRTPKGNLSRVMRHVDGIYTQRFNRRHRRDGSLFRGRYKAILIDADEYLSALVRYIHLNPVQASIVRQPEDYRWGSHRFYLEPKGAPSWLNTAEALEQIGGRKAFHEFVLSGNEESLERYYKAERQSPILGSQTFIERVKQPAGILAREHPRYQRQALQTGPDQVISAVLREYHTKHDHIFRGVRGQQNQARKVAIYLVKCVFRPKSTPIPLAKRHSFRSKSAPLFRVS
jgi:REP-associated tyrosine transposase